MTMLLAMFTAAVLQAETPAIGKPQPRNPAQWISDDDYPADALRRGEQGTVGFVLDVGADGLPRACRVTASSGWPSLDVNACSLMMQRATFTPAVDAGGKRVASTFTTRFTWRIPVDDGSTPMPTKLKITRAPEGGYRCEADIDQQLTAQQCAALAEAIAASGGDPIGTINLDMPPPGSK